MIVKESDYQLNTPIALLLFNRVSTTAKVIEAIRMVKPPKLLVVADGPRKDNQSDIKKCAGVRALIDTVDWNCQILTNYSDINLGSYKRNSSGLSWVFSIVEEAIILEDDCVPDPSFFRFCEEMLNYYRSDQRVMVISGDNFSLGRSNTPYSYYFSKYPHTWGWASWRRSWESVDLEMKYWPEFRKNHGLEMIFSSSKAIKFWDYVFQSIYEGKMKPAWDYQLIFTSFIRNCVSVVPSVNLVSNIGYGIDATHTQHVSDPFASLPTQEMKFPLQHPSYLIQDIKADKFVQNNFFKVPRFRNKLKKKLESLVKNFHP